MKNKKLVIAIAAVLGVIAVLLGVYFATRPETNAGDKNITVTVVHADGKEVKFEHSTDQEYLGRAIVEMGLVEDIQGPYGLFIEEVDGEKAVWEENGAYWSILIGEEYAVTGADEIVLEDGGEYSLVYTLG